MTLASRLSTLANLLESDGKDKGSHEHYWSVAWANLSLVQVQAIVVGIAGTNFMTKAVLFIAIQQCTANETEPC